MSRGGSDAEEPAEAAKPRPFVPAKNSTEQKSTTEPGFERSEVLPAGLERDLHALIIPAADEVNELRLAVTVLREHELERDPDLEANRDGGFPEDVAIDAQIAPEGSLSTSTDALSSVRIVGDAGGNFAGGVGAAAAGTATGASTTTTGSIGGAASTTGSAIAPASSVTGSAPPTSSIATAASSAPAASATASTPASIAAAATGRTTAGISGARSTGAGATAAALPITSSRCAGDTSSISVALLAHAQIPPAAIAAITGVRLPPARRLDLHRRDDLHRRSRDDSTSSSCSPIDPLSSLRGIGTGAPACSSPARLSGTAPSFAASAASHALSSV